jgi:hypothetical protein
MFNSILYYIIYLNNYIIVYNGLYRKDTGKITQIF